jgi:ATP-dependent DNA helicase RecQ
LETIRMVLSGVARASQRRVGCGKQLIAKMLCGSNDKAVVRNRLDQLTTFGLLGHLKQTEVAQLVDAMLAAGLLEQNEIEPFRPIVQLTARGLEVMAGRADEELSLAVSDALWRKIGGSTKAKAAVPPRVEPAPTKLEASGDQDVPDEAAFPKPDSASSAPPPVVSPQIATPATAQPSHYWTWRLLATGFTPAECAAARGLAEEVVLDHALRAAEGGLSIDALWFLSAEQIATIRNVVGGTPPERIRPLLSKLPRGTRYEHVQLVLKSR